MTTDPSYYVWARVPNRWIPPQVRYRYQPPIAHLQLASGGNGLCGQNHLDNRVKDPPRRPCKRCRKAFLKQNPTATWPFTIRPPLQVFNDWRSGTPTLPTIKPGDIPLFDLPAPLSDDGGEGVGVGGANNQPSNQDKQPSKQPKPPAGAAASTRPSSGARAPDNDPPRLKPVSGGRDSADDYDN